MAKFGELVRIKKRICAKYKKDNCVECPISDGLCGIISISNYKDEEFEELEDGLLAWAAEHPEPVYPTWREYLESIKVIVPRKNYTVMDTYSLIIGQINTTRIPADIAQKLRIEPKELAP